MTVKKTYEETIEQQLDNLNAQIKDLAAKADDAQEGVKEKYEAEVRTLEKQRDEVESKLQQLQRAGDEAFDDLKSGLDKAMGNLTNAIDSAAARFENGSGS